MVYIYKKKFPLLDDLVIARIDSINEYGIYVKLPEYDNIDGFICYKEVSRKKKKDINKIISIGKEVLLIVIAVDIEKKCIDLSKRLINEEEIELFTIKSRLHHQLYNLFKYIYMKLNNYDSIDLIDQEQLYNYMMYTLWEIQENFDDNQIILDILFNKDKNDSILDIIKYDNIEFNLEQIKKIVDHYIDTKLNVVKPSIIKNIKLLSYKINGLDDIKYALNYKSFELYEKIFNDFNIEINYLTNSDYSITLNQKDFNNADINFALDIIYNEIKKRTSEKEIIFI
jgi:translation initiation factor 2 alpha subunit (eIF-2alpha)